MHLQGGTRLGPYEIVAPIGAGGMGEVYRARDTRLGRTVAVKVLTPEFANDTKFKIRFQREAKAISALNHPHICTLYDVGESYLVMEYCEGTTLADRIARSPLPLEEALQYGIQIADALDNAHRQGVIHRDLKPSNIMVTSAGVKLLDFGLAMQQAHPSTETATLELLTGPGTIMGTVQYMAPEILRGNAADERSDLFALGLIIYEMVTGKRAFQGNSNADVIAAILEREPASVTDHNPATPPALDLLIRACLCKDPEDRIQTANDVRLQLRSISEGGSHSPRARLYAAAVPKGPRSRRITLSAIAAGMMIAAIGGWWAWREHRTAATAPMRSLVVLPFDNRSRPDDQYFVAGMHDGVIGELSQIGSLRLISRTSALHYQRTQKSIPQIARELKVDGVVEGSVVRQGESVRIQVALFRAEPQERQIFSHTYERGIRDVLSIHTDIARALAGAMNAPLSTAEAGRLSNPRRIRPETYEAYLKGMFHVQKLTPDGIQKGLEYLEAAVENDSLDPFAHAGLALAYSIVGHGPSPPPDAFARAKTAANKAIALDETTAEAHAALAGIALYAEWNWAVADREFRRALELNPNFAQAHRDYAWLLFQRQENEPIAEMNRARQLDPLSPMFNVDLSWMYWSLGQPDEAIKAARNAIDLDRSFDLGHFVMALGCASKGLHQEAIAAAQRASAIDPAWKAILAHAHASAGNRSEARKLAQEMGQKASPLVEFLLAETYATLGDKDEAFHWLQRAEQSRFSWMPWIHRDRALAPLRSDPRFQAMSRRLNLPTE